jgi:hypothetical protein
MAIYHLSVKPVKRSDGRSSVAAAAYRAAERLYDQRQGMTHNYSRKSDVAIAGIIGFSGSRSALWNKAEAAEKRKDACVAREFEVALPIELTPQQSVDLATDYGKWHNEQYGVAVDLAIHNLEGENPHVHFLTTTRVVVDNELTDKSAREWSPQKRAKEGLPPRHEDVNEARAMWEVLANSALENAGNDARIDHRSLADQGIDRTPTVKVGPAAKAKHERGQQADLVDLNKSIQADNDNNRLLLLRLAEEAELAEQEYLAAKADLVRQLAEFDRQVQIDDRIRSRADGRPSVPEIDPIIDRPMISKSAILSDRQERRQMMDGQLKAAQADIRDISRQPVHRWALEEIQGAKRPERLKEADKTIAAHKRPAQSLWQRMQYWLDSTPRADRLFKMEQARQQWETEAIATVVAEHQARLDEQSGKLKAREVALAADVAIIDKDIDVIENSMKLDGPDQIEAVNAKEAMQSMSQQVEQERDRLEALREEQRADLIERQAERKANEKDTDFGM